MLNYLGKGSYGCVISPGLTAENKIDTNLKTVSKIFSSMDAYKLECKMYDLFYNFVKLEYPHNYEEMMNKFTALLLSKSTI